MYLWRFCLQFRVMLLNSSQELKQIIILSRLLTLLTLLLTLLSQDCGHNHLWVDYYLLLLPWDLQVLHLLNM